MYMYLNTIATFSHQKQNINLKAGSNKSSWQNLKPFLIVIWQPQSHICTLKMKIIKLNLLEHMLSNYIVNKGFNLMGRWYQLLHIRNLFSCTPMMVNESNNTWKLSANSVCSTLVNSCSHFRPIIEESLYLFLFHTLTVVWVGLVNSLFADFTFIEGWIWVKPKATSKKKHENLHCIHYLLPRHC